MNVVSNRGRGRGRGRQSKTLKVVQLQNNAMGPPTRPVLRRKGSAAASDRNSRINWKFGQPSRTVTDATHTVTSITNSTVEAESNVILAITEGRGEAAGEVGIAAISTLHPSLILCQISDSQSFINTLTKINILNPSEILIPLTFANSTSANRLVEKLKEQFRDIKITGVSRSTFNSNSGMEYLKKLCVPSMNSIFLVLQHKYYALSAAAALLTYMESILYVLFAKESIKVDYQESENSTIIDVATADRLELVASARPAMRKRYSCLLDVLNYCCTRIGFRTLRANILQPPCSLAEVESRLNCVTELMEHSDILVAIQEILRKVFNIDQLLTLPMILPTTADSCTERQLNYLITLNTVLEKIEPLYCIFENSQQPFFVELYNLLNNSEFIIIKSLVQTMICQDCHLAKGERGTIQRCFAIKSGLNSVLDLMRKSYLERHDDMKKYVKDLGEKYGLALTLNTTVKRGYHIVLNLTMYQKKTFKRSNIPEEFIQVEQFTNSFVMKTEELINLSHRLEDITTDILIMSNIMIHNLLIKVNKRIAIFYQLCEGIAKLDMLQSLAQAGNSMHYTRPKFADYLELENSYHPLLYYICSNSVPNSIYASYDHNMNIITGPNGSGKSIYIRQVVLLQVMAQVGCYVPATSATFKLCDRILARVYLEDNIHYGVSAFVLEMTELKHFLTVLTDKTLIIIDELCRSTSVEEGTALAMAICERLLKTQAFVFFTTHYKHLTKLSDLYFNIKTWQMETRSQVQDNNMVLNFTYNVTPGVVSLEHYGIFLARATWPEDIMKYVDDVITVLSKSQKSTTIQHCETNEFARLKYNLESEFRLLKAKRQLKRSVIKEKLNSFQKALEEKGHMVEISLPEEMEDKESSLTSVCGMQVEVTVEVHGAPNNYTADASQFTLCTPQNMIDNYQESQERNTERLNNPQLEFDDTSLSQVPSQSLMILAANSQINISQAISQKLASKHNLDCAPSSNIFKASVILKESENDLKSPVSSKNSGFMLSAKINTSIFDDVTLAIDHEIGTKYRASPKYYFHRNGTLVNDAERVNNFIENIDSLTEEAFFLELENNGHERCSTPIFAKPAFKLPNSDSLKNTVSNSIKWMENETAGRIEGKSVNFSDVSEILNDIQSCSKYFTEMDWDNVDEVLYSQMCNKSKSCGESESQEIEKTSAEDRNNRSEMTSLVSNKSHPETNQFKQSDCIWENSKLSCSNGSTSYREISEIENYSNFKFSASAVEKSSLNRVSSTGCMADSNQQLKESFFDTMYLKEKTTSSSTGNFGNSIEWGRSKDVVKSDFGLDKESDRNLPKEIVYQPEEQVQENLSSRSEWGGIRRGELNKKDPRVKTYYGSTARGVQPERYFLRSSTSDNVTRDKSVRGGGSSETFSKSLKYEVTEILVPSTSTKTVSSASGNSQKRVLNKSKSPKCSKAMKEHRNNESPRNYSKDSYFQVKEAQAPSNSSSSSNWDFKRPKSRAHCSNTPSSLTSSSIFPINKHHQSTLNGSKGNEIGKLRDENNSNRFEQNCTQTSTFQQVSSKLGNPFEREPSTHQEGILKIIDINSEESSYNRERSELIKSSSVGNKSNSDTLEQVMSDLEIHSFKPSNLSAVDAHCRSPSYNLRSQTKKLNNNDSSSSSSAWLLRENVQTNSTEKKQRNSKLSQKLVTHLNSEREFLDSEEHKTTPGDKNQKTEEVFHKKILCGKRPKQCASPSIKSKFSENHNNKLTSSQSISPGSEQSKSRNHMEKSNYDSRHRSSINSTIQDGNEPNCGKENNLSRQNSEEQFKSRGVLDKTNDSQPRGSISNMKEKLPKANPQSKIKILSNITLRPWNFLKDKYHQSGDESTKQSKVETVSINSISECDGPMENQNLAPANSNSHSEYENKIIATDSHDTNVNHTLSSFIDYSSWGNFLKDGLEGDNLEECLRKISTPKDQSENSDANCSRSGSFNQLLLQDNSSRERKSIFSINQNDQVPTFTEDYGKTNSFSNTRKRPINKQEKDSEKTNKFSPPFKKRNSIYNMSQKEMEGMYMKQNREVLENDDVNSYLTDIFNRPSIRQLKQAQHIVTAYKTDDGVLVVPAKKKKSTKKKFIAPLKRSCTDVDVTMFSDKNWNKFEEVMSSSKDENPRARSSPFQVISSEVVSKPSHKSIFDSSNNSFSFSDNNSLYGFVTHKKSNQENESLISASSQKRVDLILQKYLDTQPSQNQNTNGDLLEISSSSGANNFKFDQGTSTFKFN